MGLILDPDVTIGKINRDDIFLLSFSRLITSNSLPGGSKKAQSNVQELVKP